MKPQQQLLDLVGVFDLTAIPTPVIDLTAPVVRSEPKGVVYTKRWVVDLILDLAGYRPEEDLAAHYRWNRLPARELSSSPWSGA